jgi:acyl-CoA synthetase (AMP-forming)/AMP-acid ligase II
VNVAGLLLRSAHQQRQGEAVRVNGRAVAYGALAHRSAQLSAALRAHGLVPGDRVALLQQNDVELVESMFGAWLAGMIVVPINSRSHPREAGYIIGDSGAAAVIYGSEYEDGLLKALPARERPLLVPVGGDTEGVGYEGLLAAQRATEAAAARRPDDAAWLFYTSGTTGHPKGAVLTHRNLRQMVLSHLADVRSFRPEESVLHAAPLTHGSGLVLLACIARGTRNVIYHGTSFDGADVLNVIKREGITSVAFVAPTQIVVLNRAAGADAADLPLESVCYGGAPMFAADLSTAMDLFGPVFVQIYGQGEAPMTITVLSADDHREFAAAEDNRIGSVGVARTDVEIAVFDEKGRQLTEGARGEIAVRGDVVMKGYWNAPQATRAALQEGWLKTGDIGLVDSSGYVFLLDRSKDLIISGGNNIYPREVEEAILVMPEVRAVAVIGLEHEYWGESVHALVVLQDDTTLSEHDVIAHCRATISSYKKPSSVEFVSDLPTNAYGKVLKRQLRDRRQKTARLAPAGPAAAKTDADS